MRTRDEKSVVFPEELRKGISALADRTREKILFTLTVRDSSYTELRKSLKIPKGSLTHHLKSLMKAGLVRNYSKERLSGPFDSFYTITDFGRNLLEAIVNSFQPIETEPTVFAQDLSSALQLPKASYSFFEVPVIVR